MLYIGIEIIIWAKGIYILNDQITSSVLCFFCLLATDPNILHSVSSENVVRCERFYGPEFVFFLFGLWAFVSLPFQEDFCLYVSREGFVLRTDFPSKQPHFFFPPFFCGEGGWGECNYLIKDWLVFCQRLRGNNKHPDRHNILFYFASLHFIDLFLEGWFGPQQTTHPTVA